jgi:hypothetical protein
VAASAIAAHYCVEDVFQWWRMAGEPFESTHWSAVMRAAGSSGEAHDALSRLCEAYWL